MTWVAIIILFALIYWESGRVSDSLRNMAKYGDETVTDLKKRIEKLENLQK